MLREKFVWDVVGVEGVVINFGGRGGVSSKGFREKMVFEEICKICRCFLGSWSRWRSCR